MGEQSFGMSTVFDKVLPTLNGMRTRVVCKRPFVRDLILAQIILPYFSDKRTFIILYSEALYRKFIKFIENVLVKCSNLSPVIDNLNVIKVGKSLECRFGRLFAFIEQGDPLEEANELTRCLNELKDDDVLIMHASMGFFFELLGDNNIKEILEIFSNLPSDITLIGFKSGERTIDSLINELYDIIVRIHQDTMIDELHYVVSVEWTFSDNLREFGRFRIKDCKIADI